MSRWPCCLLVVLAASSGSALLEPAHSGALARRRAVLARRPLPKVSWSRAEVLAALAAAALGPSRPAAAVYGEFARIGTGTQDSIAAGDAKNECLFATPGTGICQVYSSGDPKIWQEPDAKAASRKLVKAAEALGGLDEQIRASRWTSISQTLGASRDLREAVGFLVAGNAPAGAAAKKVFGRTPWTSHALACADRLLLWPLEGIQGPRRRLTVGAEEVAGRCPPPVPPMPACADLVQTNHLLCEGLEL